MSHPHWCMALTVRTLQRMLGSLVPSEALAGPEVEAVAAVGVVEPPQYSIDSRRSLPPTTTAQGLNTVYADTLEIADTDIFVNIGGFTVATVSGVSTITVPRSGVYKINCRTRVIRASGSARASLRMRANILRAGAVVDNSATLIGGGYIRHAGASTTVISGSLTFDLEAGDTIAFQIAEETDSSNTYTIGGDESAVTIFEIPAEVTSGGGGGSVSGWINPKATYGADDVGKHLIEGGIEKVIVLEAHAGHSRVVTMQKLANGSSALDAADGDEIINRRCW